MPITITNEHQAFDFENNMIILFKQISKNLITYKKEEGFVFIFNDQQVVGINIFNYKKYFSSIEQGYHLLGNEVKEYLLNNFKQFIKEEDFDSFLKIGKILDKKMHPNSEKLFVLDVEFENQKLQIITNVKDVTINKKYLFALNGATLANGIEIKESKVMNVLSQGMIVSYNSLGIKKEGIIDCENYSLNDDFVF